MPDQSQDTELKRLRTSLRRTQIAATSAFAALAFTMLMGAARAPQVLRARGLVIVDEQGREKILLGSPTPSSSGRRRKDAQSESLVFLGEDGADRVIIGQTPNPSINGETAQRIAQDWGLIFADAKGSERGGIGFLGTGRAVVAIDRPNGDAVGMMVDDPTRYAGLLVNYPTQETALEFAVRDGQGVAQFNDAQGRTRAKLQVEGNQAPAWELYDAERAPKAPQ